MVQHTHSCAGCDGCPDDVLQRIGCKHLYQQSLENRKAQEKKAQESVLPIVPDAQMDVV